MEVEKVRTPRSSQTKKRAYVRRKSAKQSKPFSPIKADEFCDGCQKRIPTARLFRLRVEAPDEKQRYCEDCAKEMERGKSDFR